MRSRRSSTTPQHSVSAEPWPSSSCRSSPPIRSRSPKGLLPGPLPVINHVAYLSFTPEQDSAELHAAGHKVVLDGR